ncbi:MAG: AAA family ATPase, partial [Anaerobiospirillum sp.]|nr:AAA family ATPase [Anaerobiospirillum sp.]
MIDISTLPRMPFWQSEWSRIQAERLFFVDKTPLILDLVKKPKVSLARPDGFGKTLLLSMIEDLFMHGTQKFQNTAICDQWPKYERYPVVRISFSDVHFFNQIEHQAADDVTAFEQSLITELGRAYHRAGFAQEEIDDYRQEATLHGFLSKLSNFSNQQRLVFLIDEWDVPLLAQLENKPRYDAIQKSLNVFYHWLLTLNLRFLFITGILHFRQKDVVDISMMPKFATLLGYTQEEVEFYFRDYLELAAQRYQMNSLKLLQVLKSHYHGFCFDEDGSVRLYSPWDINRFFAQLHDSDQAPLFQGFWINTVTAYAELRIFMELSQVNMAELDEIVNGQVVLGRSDLINPPLFSTEEFFPLLAINGYLTIQEAVEPVSDNPDDRLFVCGFPNYEVKVEFERAFLNYLTKSNSATGNKPLLTRIAQSLLNQDISTFCNLLNELFRSWRYDSSQNNIEVDYRSFITLCLALCDKFMVREETGNNKGRSDIEVELPNTNVYVFELKR